MPRDAERIGKMPSTRRDLPFLFSRQMLAGPARERVGLVVADVHYGCVRIDQPQSAEGELAPVAIALLPVARRLPALVLHGGPPIR